MNDKQELIVLSALPAAGKSTFRREWIVEDPANREYINYDELRIEMYGEDWKFNHTQENAMKQRAAARASGALSLGKSVLIDNTNLTSRARDSWKNLAKQFNAEYIQIDLDTPVEECVRRDRLRTGKARVGRAVIERMALFTGWIDWSNRELYPRNFIIVDMDGTIANCDARRKLALEGPTKHKRIRPGDGPSSKIVPILADEITIPCPEEEKVVDRQCPVCNGKPKKNWDLFYQNIDKDPPISPIIRAISAIADHLMLDVLIVSGRPIDKAGISTEDWLYENIDQFWIRHLFMRNTNDYREDFVVKQEILDLLPKNRIKYVFDDRDQVVQMWRRNGLTCLQVADGKF